jgi:hypothetical protein
MTATCPRGDDLGRLIDGELTENRAEALRAHLSACPACADELSRLHRLLGALAAPVPDAPRPGALQALMARLDEAAPGPAAPASRPWRPARRAIGLGAAAVAAAVLAIGLAVHPGPKGFGPSGEPGDDGTFAARGGAPAWTQQVGVELWALEGAPRRLDAGSPLPAGTPLVASWRNLDRAPAYLLAFALDARGEVHWLYPAHLDAGQDPEAVRLEGAVARQAMAESVILQDVAPGPLSLVTVLSRQPRRVSDVEGVPPEARTAGALRARWPDARVDDLVVLPAAGPTAPPRP